jgi:hypothetical protein
MAGDDAYAAVVHELHDGDLAEEAKVFSAE